VQRVGYPLPVFGDYLPGAGNPQNLINGFDRKNWEYNKYSLCFNK
jgi:hypothetical protein